MPVKSDRTHRYDDIITLPHPVPLSHPPMPRAGRAAQFAPFSALSGHGAAILETARLTEKRAELDEEQVRQLDRRLQLLWTCRGEQPEITVTYFQPDSRKDGGSYITSTGSLVKLNRYTGELLLSGHPPIPICQIYGLEGAVLERLERLEE